MATTWLMAYVMLVHPAAKLALPTVVQLANLATLLPQELVISVPLTVLHVMQLILALDVIVVMFTSVEAAHLHAPMDTPM